MAEAARLLAEREVEMIFRWLDVKPAKALGTELARIFMDAVPNAADVEEKKFESRIRSAVVKMGRHIDASKQRRALNGYQRAQAANTFKWQLRDAGYRTDYVDRLTEVVVLKLR